MDLRGCPKRLFLFQTSWTTWPFETVETLSVDSQSKFSAGLPVRANHLDFTAHENLDVTLLQSWTFDSFKLNSECLKYRTMDPEQFLRKCSDHGVILGCHSLDVSQWRQFEPNDAFFDLLMQVMPRLTCLRANACNWSPSMARMLENNLHFYSQIQDLEVDDN